MTKGTLFPDLRIVPIRIIFVMDLIGRFLLRVEKLQDDLKMKRTLE